MLQTCPSCDRHVFADEAACPFCRTALGGVVAPIVAAVVVTMVGCGSPGSAGDLGGGVESSGGPMAVDTGGDDDDDDSADEFGHDDTGSPMGGTTFGGDSSTGEGAEDSGGGFVGFIYGSPDFGRAFECDLFAQDCPDGEKCIAWANDGGGGWNATRCSPIAQSPQQVGDACTVEGSATSGVDDCDLGSMCWDIDRDTNQGTCVSQCFGDEAMPICEDPDTRCAITNNGAIALCLPVCDPLLQDCVEGQACYPVNQDFACAPDVSAENGAYGDACEFINVCDPGLFCLGATALPNCVGSGCCSPACDVTEARADAQCSDAHSQLECLPWYGEEEAPPGYDHVGVCALPD